MKDKWEIARQPPRLEIARRCYHSYRAKGRIAEDDITETRSWDTWYHKGDTAMATSRSRKEVNTLAFPLFCPPFFQPILLLIGQT